MVIRVLMINRQLVFAVTIKQALEQTGAFEVHPFTDPSAAMEYLRTHPHDVALVDFAITVMPGAEIVRRLREIQPEIAVIVSPMQPDSNRVVRELGLQGIVDAPFSARGIIPLIEHAAEQMSQPSQAVTRNFVEPEQPVDVDTEILSRPEASEPHPQYDEPAQTRIFPPEEESRPQTRSFASRDDLEEQAQTRILRDESDDDVPQNLPHTWIIGDHQPPAEDDAPPEPPRIPADTRILDDDEEPAAPPYLPEFSSLDDVLADEQPSTLFEPPIKDGDTPPVPDVDSEAVRQFLATSSKSDDRTFDSMLGEIVPDESAAAPRELPGGDFRDLVDSMRLEKPYTPLPDRHQQFVEFILTGGMDHLITEIGKAKTDAPADTPPPEREPQEKPPLSSFDQLAADEPPLPTLEEGGTISDLMIGVSDTSFRNVLSMMRGEEVVDDDTSDQSASRPSRQEIEAAYAAFFDQEIAGEVDSTELPALPEAELDEPSITAQLILETALDESTPADAFSLDMLIDNIERQLGEHKPEIKPLPSWRIPSLPSKQLKRIEPKDGPDKPVAKDAGDTGRYVQEPDFLPEEFPEPPPSTAEELPPDVLWEMMRRVEEARTALDKALEIEQQIEDEEQDTGPDGPELEPAVEPEWLIDDAPLAEETVLGSDRETTLTEPPSMPEEVFLDEDDEEEPTRVPASVWEEPVDDWSVETDWDNQPAAASKQEPTAVPGFADDWELTIDEEPGDETVVMPRSQPAHEQMALGMAADFEPQAEIELSEPDDPYIAQIALSLTQVSLELAAEATLLTSDDEIVAFAGELSQEDAEELRRAIADDWTANPNEARIRFITLASSGKDYMLYSRKTVNDFTLTMIFAGTTPLRDIRRQGRRLIEALENVPETLPAEAPESLPEVATMTGEIAAVEPEAPVTMQPFTYLWLLRQPDIPFNERTGRALAAGLTLQLREMGWQVKSLRAQGEYVYVHADVPGEHPAYEVIDDLKRRAADIVHAQEPDLYPDALWADSYLVMMPGRELDPDEIDQFINFERMA